MYCLLAYAFGVLVSTSTRLGLSMAGHVGDLVTGGCINHTLKIVVDIAFVNYIYGVTIDLFNFIEF
jgi:hypothetical protein